MIVCGFLNAANKDMTSCVLRADGDDVRFCAIAEERLSRVKFPYFSPVRSISYCMESVGVDSMEQIDWFILDWVRHRRLSNSTPSYRKLEYEYFLQNVRAPREKIIFCESHHRAHAASAYYPSGFDEAAILIVDGQGSDMETVSLYHGHGNQIRLIERSRHYGLGQLYTGVTRRILRFGVGEEGKTMGLAPFHKVRNRERILPIDARYSGTTIDYSRFLERMPNSEFKFSVPPCSSREEVTSDYYTQIAWEVQDEIEKAMMHLARYAREKTGSRNICLAGGVALNCVANDKILEHGIFDDIFIQPGSGDTGIAFGLALDGYFMKHPEPRRFPMRMPYTGRTYRNSAIEALLDRFAIPFSVVAPSDVAELLSSGNIVGWFNGGSEYGPRALGARSIVADPRDPGIRDIMNAKVKHRELFRPFAPSVIAERANEYFELKSDSPYMLLAPKAREKAKKEVPAIVHVDDTCRVQTVHKDWSPDYHALISAFAEKTGTPVILNTSFNDNGEPIVETPVDALLCFMRTKIDFLYLQGRLVEKSLILSRRDELVAELEAYRNETLLEDYKTSVRKVLKSYDPSEMRSYLKREKEKSEYIKNHSVIERCIDAFHSLAESGRPVEVLIDAYHTELLEKFESWPLLNARAIHVIEDNLPALESFMEVYRPAEGSLVLVLLYDAGPAAGARLEKIKQEHIVMYGDFDWKMKPEHILAPQEGVFNLEGVERLSNEASRSKDWDGFFRTL